MRIYPQRKKELADKFIIDTDVCIDFLKGQEYAIYLIKELLINENAYLSILTYYELLRGAYTKKQQKAVEDFVNGFEVLNIDKEITNIGAKFYRDYRKIYQLLTLLLWQQQRNMN